MSLSISLWLVVRNRRFSYVPDMDELLKRGSLNRKHEEDMFDFTNEGQEVLDNKSSINPTTVIPRLTKTINSGITFVTRNVISRRFL